MRSSRQYRQIISRPDGGSPARTDKAVTASSRRLNAPYMLGRYVTNSASRNSPIAASTRRPSRPRTSPAAGTRT